MGLSHSRVPPHGSIPGSHPRVPPHDPGSWVPPQGLGLTYPICRSGACNFIKKRPFYRTPLDDYFYHYMKPVEAKKKISSNQPRYV